MNIEGNKIGIRTFQYEDIVPFYEAAIESIEHMREFMPWCHPEYSISESEAWVLSRAKSWADSEEYSFIIYSLENNELLGGAGINQINHDHKIGNIGYWIRKKALNQGVASEAVSLVSDFGFSSLGLERLEIVMLPNNVASRRVAEKSGAKYEGILQNRLLVYGNAQDACMYSLVRMHNVG